MGSSTKKKNEKKKDFAKPKLKVGKAQRPKDNATSTSFTAKSIILKQQSVSESRDAAALFNHNLSLLSAKAETQRRDALQFLTTAVLAAGKDGLPQPASAIVAKAQPLILDGNTGVRQALLKLFKALPAEDIGSVDQILLYTRAGMTHLSADIRLSSLDLMDWLLQTNSEGIMSCPGGWVKTLRTFQNLLGWQSALGKENGGVAKGRGEKWTAAMKPAGSGMGSSKLLVHQLHTLATFLTAGLSAPPAEPNAGARRAAKLFPLCQTDAHSLAKKSNSLGYLNLFGATRDVESETYDDAEERVEVFNEAAMLEAFTTGTKEAKKEAGEIGRAASAVEKALKVAEIG
ncbi:pre-rRNA-processing protein ipi1-like [Teratosphaeria destructans]|uniref:Pre-rRNA-processing protein n=1 Tax=Teratosphaeria destructans TaxID=418781 RepID=A0A9W7T2R4_9PEZI|nr:pre-rRNA-processing protein ipi1-like [Teratosphaeria destructans]